MVQKVLRSLNTDATFDQVGVLEKKLAQVKADGGKKVYSYDLSSATDRLPIWLQVRVLEPVIGLLQAAGWASTLVDREYKTPKDVNIPSVKYAVGQPMGALSS
jgi:hypothetical protein